MLSHFFYFSIWLFGFLLFVIWAIFSVFPIVVVSK